MLNFESQEQLLEYLSGEEGREVADKIKSPLLAKRDELLSEMKTLKTRLDGYDPQEVESLRERAARAAELEKALESAQANTSDDKLEELKNSMNQQLEAERARHKSFLQSYEQNTALSKMREAIVRHKGIPELLTHAVAQRVRSSVNDQGEVTLEVLSREGKPLFVEGAEATLDHLVKELSTDEKYSRAFEVDTPTGSGSRGKNPLGTKDLSNMSISERMKLAANNPGILASLKGA